MHTEVWFKLWCPKCHVANWLYDGSWSIVDSSEMDISACKCNSCSHCWWLHDQENLDPFETNERPEDYADYGLKAPTGYTND